MKYLVRFAFPLVAVVIGMTAFFYLSNTKETTTFDVKHTEITAFVDDTFNAYTKCGISYFSAENVTPTFSSSNTNILTIEEHSGKVVCLTEGSVKICVKLQTNTEPIMEEILVSITEKVIYPTSMAITYETITLTGENDYAINPLILDETTLTPQIWSESGFAQYDYTTGKVTTTKSDTIYISIPKNPTENITISFEIIVEEPSTTEEMEITLSLHETKKISYTLDATSTENQTISAPQVEDESILQIQYSNVGYVKVKALKTGQTTISISLGSQTLLIHVTVVE